MIGKTISHYRVTEKLGAGAHCKVYEENRECLRKRGLRFLL